MLGTQICYIHGKIDQQKKKAGKQMQAGVYNREQVRLHSSSGYLRCESTDRDLPGVWGGGPGGAHHWDWAHLNGELCTAWKCRSGNKVCEEYHCLLLTVTGARCQYVHGEYI